MPTLSLLPAHSSFEFSAPLLLALICGALIGAERTRNGSAAGVRTFSMVCFVGAVLMAMMNSPQLWGDVSGNRGVDPTRVIQGVLTGIGFLCGGIILRDGLHVRGLTSAMAVWATSVIGIVIGSGFYAGGVFLTLITLVTLLAGPFFEQLLPKYRYIVFTARVKSASITEKELKTFVGRHDCHVVGMTYKKHAPGDGMEYTFTLRTTKSNVESKFVAELKEDADIVSFTVGDAP